MGKAARTVYSSHEQTVDHTTGEVTRQTSSNVVRLASEPEYVKMYLADLGQLMHLTNGEQQLLNMLVVKIDWEGMISLNAASRKRICEKMDIAPKSLRNRLSGLCKKGVIHRHDQNEYEVNPHYFAKGEWRAIQERRKDFELLIRYYQNGEREVTTRGIDPDE